MNNTALGIDIGGTKISFCKINKNGEIISEIKKESTPKTKEDIEKILKKIIDESSCNVDFIAIATAGTVNKENSKVIGSTANLPFGYKDIDFEKLSNKKVFIENDANCAAYAEYIIGASKGYDNNIMLTLGTGVGGGIIIDGKLFKGSIGAAGEMHFALSRKKERQCTCGAWDCFEIYASGNGLRLTGKEIFNDENITTYNIIEYAKNNDERALLALNRWQEDITLGVLGLTNLFNPQCVVLSGSMAQFCDNKKIEDFVNSKTVTSKIKVFIAQTQNHAGMIGAVLLGYKLLNF